ncbi:MAG: LPXTG cell wall anchor domain-containing protein [Gammaproteobacteria bacterium]|nr:LPXTG cell wall anchor domain-containing protein [Gammaproteobacteria bacterium]
MTVDGDFVPAGGPALPPPPAVPTMNSFGLLAMALALMLGAGLFLRRRV